MASDRNAKRDVRSTRAGELGSAIAGTLANLGAAYLYRRGRDEEDATADAASRRRGADIARATEASASSAVAASRGVVLPTLRDVGTPTPYLGGYAPTGPGTVTVPYLGGALGSSDPYAAVDRITSDERSKVDVRAVRDMLSHLRPHSYEYREDAGMPEGRHIGVMAQELERSDLGRSFVGRDPDTGYRDVDYGRALPTMLAGLADVARRVERVEGRAKKTGRGR
jgi:hypothetical protein